MTVESKKALCEVLCDVDGIVQLDGDILCHVGHAGAYTDLGTEEELRLLEELRARPWRDVVRERYAARSPWLYRIITDASRSRMLKELDRPLGGRFLDVGSGWGQITIPLAVRGEAHALDLTPDRLRIVREISRQEGAQLRLHCGNLLTYPFREAVFDLIIINGVLEYLGLGRPTNDYQSHLEALRRVHSLLKPNGQAYVGIENATGLKYLLGAPDDHTGRSRFTFLLNRQEGAEARTWALDQYLDLFREAALTSEKTFACFPDYKLIQHMVPLETVDRFLLEKGLPAREHSGVDGAPLGLDEELRSLYLTMARLGVSRYFVPSFGFVLRRRVSPAAACSSQSPPTQIAAAEALPKSQPSGQHESGLPRLVPAPSRVDYAEALRTHRYYVREGNHPVASVKQIPQTGPFDSHAILAVYDEYRRGRSFRPVRLLKSWRDEHSLWVMEEYISGATSLDDWVQEEKISADAAVGRIVSIADEIWELASPANAATLESELQACKTAFAELFENRDEAECFHRLFREMMLSQRTRHRSVLTTRDYIGRNILLTDGGECVLIDYDLARRTTLFALDLSRSFFHVPYCTERLLQAKALQGLDPLLLKIGAVAAECALQRQVHPPDRHEAIIHNYRSLLLRLLSPRQMGQIEGEIQRAREYQANLERQIAALRRPRVDVMVVNYNGARWIDGFVDGLRRTSYPIERLRLIFVDNGSTDGSLEHAQRRAEELPFPTIFVQTGRNAGFSGGYAKAFECGQAEYYFVINADTVMAPDAIDRLIAILEADPQAGIAEARQSPLEHPKYYDPVTRETSWCSGACMMVRTVALRSIGGAFDPSFFMYAEDVDLSWRMWLHGWKCLYVREAVVEHFTEHLDPKRDHSVQHYYSMRNGALMRMIYGSWGEVLLHYAAMLRVGTLSHNPRRHKYLTLKAVFTSLRWLPRALRKRHALGKRGRNLWIFFDGWLYGRHARDPAAANQATYGCNVDLVAAWETARKELQHDLPLDQHIVRLPDVHVAAVRRRSILVYDSARLHYRLAVPQAALLVGAVAAPQDAWKPTAMGSFEVLQDGERIWQCQLDLAKSAHRQWVPFEVPLRPTTHGSESQITLSFNGGRDLVWGLWGEVRLIQEDSHPSEEQLIEDSAGLVVSLVVPTHNRADRVERVIRRLMAQDIAPNCFEVILVDSNSRDDTPQTAARLADRYANLKTLRCDRPGAAAARNMGLEAAKADLIVLLDDDILVGADFLRRLLAASREHPGCVLLGRIMAPWEGACNPFHRYLLQVQDVNIYDFPDSAHVPANYFYTACVAIPRAGLGDLRFDEGFRIYGVEDIEFGFRLLAGQTRMVFLPDVRVMHDYHPTYRGYRRKKRMAGYSLGYFLAQHPEHAHRFQFGPRFRRYYHLLRVLRVLGAPLAGALYLGERLLYREGPVNRALYWWWYTDLRIQLYSGLRRYRRGAPLPSR